MSQCRRALFPDVGSAGRAAPAQAPVASRRRQAIGEITGWRDEGFTLATAGASAVAG